MKIILDKSGKAIGDLKAKDFILENINETVHVSTNNVITVLKLLILKEVVDYEDVTLEIDGKEVSMNAFGNIKENLKLKSLDWDFTMTSDILNLQLEHSRKSTEMIGDLRKMKNRLVEIKDVLKNEDKDSFLLKYYDDVKEISLKHSDYSKKEKYLFEETSNLLSEIQNLLLFLKQEIGEELKIDL